MKQKVIALSVAAFALAAVALAVLPEKNRKAEPVQTDSGSTEETVPVSAAITLPFATDTVIPVSPVVYDISCESVTLQEEYNLYGEPAILNRADVPVFGGGIDFTEINATLHDFCRRAVSISDSDRIVAEEKYGRAERQGTDYSCDISSTYFEWYEYGGVISITFTTTVSGETYDNISCASFAFDLDSGKRMNLAEYMKSSRRDVTAFLSQYLEHLIAQNPAAYYDDASENLKYVLNLSNFRLTEKGVSVYFNPGEIANEQSGVISVLIPYDQLK